jgi:hypothetical protein
MDQTQRMNSRHARKAELLRASDLRRQALRVELENVRQAVGRWPRPTTALLWGLACGAPLAGLWWARRPRTSAAPPPPRGLLPRIVSLASLTREALGVWRFFRSLKP